MICEENNKRAQDLNHCAVAPYSNGVLHVGTMATNGTGRFLRLTNLATNRRVLVPIDAGVLPLVDVELPDGLAVDQLYKLEVYGKESTELGGGVVPFRGYFYDPATDSYTLHTTEILSCTVAFRKHYDPQGALLNSPEQWISY